MRRPYAGGTGSAMPAFSIRLGPQDSSLSLSKGRRIETNPDVTSAFALHHPRPFDIRFDMA